MSDDLPACPTCGKRCYPSWKVAETKAKLARRGNDVRGKRRIPMTVYMCDDGAIHLTSSKDRDHPGLKKTRRGRRGR